MKKITIGIVENEDDQVKTTKELCDRYSKEHGFTIDILSFKDGYDFLEKDSSIFDCIFMDIDMPGINGMETSMRLRQSNPSIPIVFVTNLPQFAIDGYKVQALDFIIKPMSYADFSIVMDKIVSLCTRNSEEDFFITIRNEMMRIHHSDIVYFEMKNHNVNIHMKDQSVLSYRETIKELEGKIKDKRFYKCNSGIIVNLDYVDSIKDDICVLNDKTTLQVSRSRRSDFLKAMADFYFKTGI